MLESSLAAISGFESKIEQTKKKLSVYTQFMAIRQFGAFLIVASELDD